MVVLYLIIGAAFMFGMISATLKDPNRARRERLCDSQPRDGGDAYFIRKAGDTYVTQCFGPALPI